MGLRILPGGLIVIALSAAAAVVFGLIAGCLVLFIGGTIIFIANLCSVEKLPAGEAVTTIYQHWVGNPARASDLPNKLRGAFWMSDNPGAELGASFEGAEVDTVARTVSFWPGGTHGGGFQWTYNSDFSGWLLYAMDRVFMQNKYIFRFDENFSKATISFVMYGLIPIPSFIAKFTMEANDPDGNSWQRTTYVLGRKILAGTYTLKKVIDAGGQKLPAFADMEKEIDNQVKVRGQTVKTSIQLVPKPFRLFCSCCGASKDEPLTPKSDNV